MPTYSADQVIDKFLYVKKGKTVKVYSSTMAEIKVLLGGELVGQVYSWIMRNGSLYWELYNRTYVKHETGTFTEIASQGALTVEEEAKQDAGIETTFFEKMKGYINILLGMGFIIAVLTILPKYLKK